MDVASHSRVAAIVVTYNRPELLVDCLNALKRQTYHLSAIYVIDNASTDTTGIILRSNGYLSETPPTGNAAIWQTAIDLPLPDPRYSGRLCYSRLPQNIGGAGGFSVGLEEAHSAGYDWFWLMDDDAEPENDALQQLMRLSTDPTVAALATRVVDIDGGIVEIQRGRVDARHMYPLVQEPLPSKWYDSDLVEIDAASFVGFLVSRSAVNKVGYPEGRFFIYHDDIEYSLRVRLVGRIVLVPGSIIVHKHVAGNGVWRRFLWKKQKRVPYSAYWVTFYGVRNAIWLSMRYGRNRNRVVLNVVRRYIHLVRCILMWDDRKLRRIWMLTSAHIDGFRGVFVNNRPRRILYKA